MNAKQASPPVNSLCLRDRLLATLGLVALGAYVLACASFSPDGSKVLYPAFDPKTGAAAINLYDRNSKTSMQVFVLPGMTGHHDGPALRPQWTPDGKHMVAAWADPAEHDRLNLVLLPPGGRGVTRFFQIADMEDAGQKLVSPLAMAGPFLFACVQSNVVLRLDLATGETKTNAYQGEMTLYPGPRGDTITYVGKGTSQPDVMEVGRLDMESLVVRPIATIPDSSLKDGGAVAFGRNGSDVALLLGDDPAEGLLIRRGATWEKRGLPKYPRETMHYGFPEWSADGRVLYLPYGAVMEDQAGCTFGLAEIPLDGSAARRTPLFKTKGGSLDSPDIWTFPIGLSPDGKTVGTSSTYLAASNRLKVPSEAVALYLVDVSGSARKVTKVPIAMSKAMRD